MWQLQNHTPLAAAWAVLPDPVGIDTLYVIVRATFELDPFRFAQQQTTPVLTDEYFGEPGKSSIKYASELHTGKAGTDVVLVGSAHPPRAPVTESAVVVATAERKKVVHVLGDRYWAPFGKSRPEPFESMPLMFERAFGGRQVLSTEPLAILEEERNPVGVGFQGRQPSKQMHGTLLPNLEDPRHALDELGDEPPPACFGFVAPGWMPRRSFAGTYDADWQRRRAPYLPKDFQSRFSNMAAPELTFPRFLEGGEPVEVLGASRRGAIRFSVPRLQPRVTVIVANSTQRPPAQLETLLLEPDANRMSVSYRAALQCDRKTLQIEKIEIDATGGAAFGG